MKVPANYKKCGDNMLKGHFENCYGLKNLILPDINFTSCNKAIIYAPNGVMKSSLARVLNDIANGRKTQDRVFQERKTKYSVEFFTNTYSYDSNSENNDLQATNTIYVIDSSSGKNEIGKQASEILLASSSIRNEYDDILKALKAETKEIEDRLRVITVLTKTSIRPTIAKDFNLPENATWIDIITTIQRELSKKENNQDIPDVKYAELFNDSTNGVYSSHEFQTNISEYIDKINEVYSKSDFIKKDFTGKNAEELGKSFKNNNLFNVGHTIQLSKGQGVVHDVTEWNACVKKEVQKIYDDESLKDVFEKVRNLLSANEKCRTLQKILAEHKELIPMLNDIPLLKKQLWCYYFVNLPKKFDEYYTTFDKYAKRTKELIVSASKDSEKWKAVVDLYNTRFKVPFVLTIGNKADVTLNDQKPSIDFHYKDGPSEKTIGDDLIKKVLSTGEYRALDTLYTLFDLEGLKEVAASNQTSHYLVVADDIVDSFDYKNKYAIIEYLNDISKEKNINLLMLTHNFDFYRTTMTRLGIPRENCFAAERNKNGEVSVRKSKYRKDIFKSIFVNNLQATKPNNLLGSIPFYRNICDYLGKEDELNKLTCLLHIKKTPIETETTSFGDICRLLFTVSHIEIEPNNQEECYLTVLYNQANSISSCDNDDLAIEEKEVLAIAVRLQAEQFMIRRLSQNNIRYEEAKGQQFKDLSKKCKEYCSDDEKKVIEEINIITPDSIHLNSFMFEPLIDVSGWELKDNYQKIKVMNQTSS